MKFRVTPRAVRLACLVTIFSGLWEFSASPAPAKPNILWLIAEDFGPHLGCYGAKQVFTPNLDQLARDGARYTRFFTRRRSVRPAAARS